MNKIPNVFGIEGIDRLGKSTLIQGILDRLGYYQVIHFAKPQKLKVYQEVALKSVYQADGGIEEVPEISRAAYLYQLEGFRNSMLLANSGARIIFDRWHLGEYTYSPMYRSYSGSYVFEQELRAGIQNHQNLRLILLYEDFRYSKHFVDDGNSLGTPRDRDEEQQRFVNAFNFSHIRDKRIVCVTDLNTGMFRKKEDILEEVII